jgi:NAD(P)-dependent dehydrogenase (short-subunit alcohol dehydrogenase family)
MSIERVALVTGSNRGIGYALVQQLATKFKGIVYLTARSDELGKIAVESLAKEGLAVKYHQLDIDNVDSIKKCADYIQKTHGGLDLLINNAAIAYKSKDTTPFKIQAEVSFRVNFMGTLNVCNEFFKILRSHARVVQISSRAGELASKGRDAETIIKLASGTTTTDEIIQIGNKFIEAARAGSHENISKSAYGFSKACLNALTEEQQRQFNKDSREDLIVNSVCPGWTSTGMSSNTGRPVEESVPTILYLALLPENVNKPKGEFWSDMQSLDWKKL